MKRFSVLDVVVPFLILLVVGVIMLNNEQSNAGIVSAGDTWKHPTEEVYIRVNGISGENYNLGIRIDGGNDFLLVMVDRNIFEQYIQLHGFIKQDGVRDKSSNN